MLLIPFPHGDEVVERLLLALSQAKCASKEYIGFLLFKGQS